MVGDTPIRQSIASRAARNRAAYSASAAEATTAGVMVLRACTDPSMTSGLLMLPM